jgi:Pyruvate/2-oxoacid:ferredoxin oxidoreductase delta subunit
MGKNIIKANGKAEPYDEKKINLSFIKAGASPWLATEATRAMNKKIKNNMSTAQIYNKALSHLKKIEPKVALKYSLKRAMMNMGPEGFIFEEYIARILREYGYTAEVGQFVKGYCIEHEVDVVAKKEGKIYLIECKYHNSPGVKSDVKTALYVNSRFIDIEKAYIEENNLSYDPVEAMLITNTKCTSDAIQYANCAGLKIMAWECPEVENLQYFIEGKKLYPVNILTTISPEQKEKLFNSNIILIKELLDLNIDNLTELLSINHVRAEKILNEIRLLM